MKEAYVSFEIAKLLKEKGFDEETNWYYNSKGYCEPFSAWVSAKPYDYSPMPTHQMACAWLRDVHKLHISVGVSPLYGKVKDEKGRNTCGLLYWHYMASGEWVNEKYNPNQKAFVVSAKSYEDAVESAIKYSLENLI